MTSSELLVNIPQFEADLGRSPHLMMEILRGITKGSQDHKRQKYAP